jgi:hypothetical protein
MDHIEIIISLKTVKTVNSKKFVLENTIYVNLNSLDCRCDREVLLVKQLAILLGCE